MAQRRKPEIRARIVAAAQVVFAAHGYQDAKMATIAEEAELSAGNLYRYFKGKAELFDAVIDPDFVHRFDTLLEARVEALTSDAQALMPAATTQLDAERLLGFWVEHRLRVVILLDRAQGSRHANYGDRFVERLVAMTTRHLERRRGGGPLPEVVSLTLDTIFHTSRRAVVTILERYDEPEDIRRGFEAFWSFQLPGLAAFEAWVTR